MAHPATDLHSADHDLSRKSWSDGLSPADGRFNPSGIASSSMVLHPTIGREMEAEDRTLTTSKFHSSAFAHATSHAPPSPSSDTPGSPVSPHQNEDMFAEPSHLLNGAPPAYTPRPTSPTSSYEPLGGSYCIFPEHRLDAGLPPPREPENMAAPVYEPTERSPLAAGPLQTDRRRTILKLALAALVLALVTVLMTSRFHLDKSEGGIPNFPGHVNDKSPAKSPIDLVEPYCETAKTKEDEVIYEFPTGADFTVLQTTYGADDSRGLARVNTVGEVRIRRLPKDSEQGDRAYLTVNAYVSDPSLEIVRTWDENSSFLKISTPRSARLDTRVSHCVSLQITAWFPEDVELSNLWIQSITLSLRMIDDVKIKVTGQSKFSSISGHVSFPSVSAGGLEMQSPGWTSSEPDYHFFSRRILVETMSGHIDGNYPLMDFLGLSSESGSVNVDVMPQEVLKEAPRPADLEVHTVSGNIQVNCPVGAGDPAYKPPPRNYITNVHSSTGSIHGSFYLGSTSDFRSNSGTITIIGLPVLQDDGSTDVPATPKNTLATRTVSGRTKVQILEPIFIALAKSLEKPTQIPTGEDTPFPRIQPLFVIDPRAATADLKLRSLKSTHASSSALVDVQYPDAWEGYMRAKTVSGRIYTSGKGIRIIKERKGAGNRELVMRKGAGGEEDGCLVEMQDISGSLHFTAGVQAA
ncbi:unnamed protein product [Diplocarpon coronariae]